MKLHTQTLLLIAVLFSIITSHAQIEGKYRAVQNKKYKAVQNNLIKTQKGVVEFEDTTVQGEVVIEVVQHHKQKKQTNKLKQEIIKEFKKNGTFTSHTINKYDKVLNFSGKYKVISDSIYIEFIEYNLSGNHNGDVLPMRYEIRNDTLIQKGEAYYKVNRSRNTYYKTPFVSTWVKIKD